MTDPGVPPRPWAVAPAWDFIEALLAAPTTGMLCETNRHAAVRVELATTVPQSSAVVLALRSRRKAVSDRGE